MRKSTKFAPEVQERAVRLVLEHQDEHGSQWAAIGSIAGKIGCTSETLRRWVRQTERDQGKRPGATTSETERIKALDAKIASYGKPTRSCARPAHILPRRRSTAGSSHDGVH